MGEIKFYHHLEAHKRELPASGNRDSYRHLCQSEGKLAFRAAREEKHSVVCAKANYQPHTDCV
jgi:hypothetical protein